MRWLFRCMPLLTAKAKSRNRRTPIESQASLERDGRERQRTEARVEAEDEGDDRYFYQGDHAGTRAHAARTYYSVVADAAALPGGLCRALRAMWERFERRTLSVSCGSAFDGDSGDPNLKK